MKTKSLFPELKLFRTGIILNVKCLMFSFIFFLLFNIQYSTFNIACAQPAKGADKPATANLPSIIKKIDMPWPVSVTVDEKENRIFVMSAADENSAVFMLNGRDNSIIKKIKVKEGFDINAGANGIAYNPNTKKLYTLTNWKKNTQDAIMAVIDTKAYDVKTVRFSDPEEQWCCFSLSINLDKSGNMVYTFPSSYPYILAFNGSSLKLMDKIKQKVTVYFGEIDEKGDFIYLTADDRFIKFDLKAKKIAGSLPIKTDSIPLIDEKNGLIFAGTAYKLYIIDLKTFKMKDEREDIPVSGTFGASVALNPTTNHLFVPTYNDSVSVIDVATMKILTTIKVGTGIKSIAVNSQTNRVYVTLVNYENKVVVIQDR